MREFFSRRLTIIWLAASVIFLMGAVGGCNCQCHQSAKDDADKQPAVAEPATNMKVVASLVDSKGRLEATVYRIEVDGRFYIVAVKYGGGVAITPASD